MVIAAVADGREASLRKLLDSMNLQPGMADPDNLLVPFGRFERYRLFLRPPNQTVVVLWQIDRRH